MTVATSPKVKCRVCEDNGVEGNLYHFLDEHLEDAHTMSLQEYLDKYGEDTPFASNVVWNKFLKEAPEERKGTRRYDNVIKVGNINLERQAGDTFDISNRPEDFFYPKKGPASKAAERVARAFKYQRNLFIYGPAGAGKSAIIRALSNDLNIEFTQYPMREGLDPELYLGKEAVVIDKETGMNKTQYVKGKLLRDLEGRVGHDGERRGVCLLIDDWDRAPAQYHEVFRHILEDNSQNVFIPELGVNVDIHPDTRIIATANSAGRGDMTGLYSSVQEVDESILDRFQRVVQYHFLEPEEEKKILRKKFDYIHEVFPRAFDDVMNVASGIRRMIQENLIYATFSHRRIVQWLLSVEELITENGDEPFEGVLREAANDWLEWYDEETRESVVKRVVETHCPKRPGT